MKIDLLIIDVSSALETQTHCELAKMPYFSHAKKGDLVEVKGGTRPFRVVAVFDYVDDDNEIVQTMRNITGSQKIREATKLYSLKEVDWTSDEDKANG